MPVGNARTGFRTSIGYHRIKLFSQSTHAFSLYKYLPFLGEFKYHDTKLHVRHNILYLKKKPKYFQRNGG